MLELSAQGNLIPIYRELPADLDTPVSVYLKLAGHGASFLLESVEGGEQVGRYSFIGIEPNAVLSFNGRSYTPPIEWSRDSTVDLPKGKDPLHVLQAELARFTPVALPGLPRFVGGLVGYLGYDVIRFFEPKLDVDGERPIDTLPEAILHVDRYTRRLRSCAGPTCCIIVNVHLNGDPDAAYDEAIDADRSHCRATRLRRCRHSSLVTHHLPQPLDFQLHSAGFEEIVRQAKEHIAAGDIFQVVLSQRLSRRTSAQPFDIYRALRRLNPSPYMFFFDFGTSE